MNNVSVGDQYRGRDGVILEVVGVSLVTVTYRTIVPRRNGDTVGQLSTNKRGDFGRLLRSWGMTRA